jgi:hypothetical protein
MKVRMMQQPHPYLARSHSTLLPKSSDREPSSLESCAASILDLFLPNLSHQQRKEMLPAATRALAEALLEQRA